MFVPDIPEYLKCTRSHQSFHYGFVMFTAIRSFINWFMLISLPIQSEISLVQASELLEVFN